MKTDKQLMAKWYREKIGFGNWAGLTLICSMIAVLSILSLASTEEAGVWRAHPVQFFFGRLIFLMRLCLALTAILVFLNILYNLIYRLQDSRKWYANILPVTMWSVLVSLVFAVLGTLFLLG